jgi:hypothetical protein
MKPARSRYKQRETSACQVLAGFLGGVIINPEDGGNIFPQNVRPFPNCTVLQCRSHHIHFCVESGVRGSCASWIVVHLVTY